MKDNFDILKDFMDFSDPDKFYLVQVVQRLKDNPGMKQSDRIIKHYMIPSLEKLERVREEMETLCNVFNARIYMYINRRSYKQTQTAMVKKLVDQICIGTTGNLNHLFDSCAASHGCGDKFWIIDVDLPHRPDVCSSDSYMRLESDLKLNLYEYLDKLPPTLSDGEHRVKLVVPSRNGFHLITSPFDTRYWESVKNNAVSLEYKYGLEIGLELKKDAMVNLILPKEQEQYYTKDFGKTVRKA